MESRKASFVNITENENAPKSERHVEDTQEKPSRRPSVTEVLDESMRRKSVNNKRATGASQITTRQSIIPVSLVTILFFLWGFAYGLLDVLNKHFQETLGVTKGQGSGLAAAYFGAYFIAPLTYAGWIVRRWGYRYTFMTGKHSKSPSISIQC
jgi:MFS transporter, FHS family, L-fucose permease